MSNENENAVKAGNESLDFNLNTVAFTIKVKKLTFLTTTPPQSFTPPKSVLSDEYDYPDVDLVNESYLGSSGGSYFYALALNLTNSDSTTMKRNMGILSTLSLNCTQNFGLGHGRDEFDEPRSAQNAGMTIDYILEKYAQGQSLNVMAKGRISDERNYTPEQVANATTTKQSIFDGVDFARATYKAKADSDAAAAATPPSAE